MYGQVLFFFGQVLLYLAKFLLHGKNLNINGISNLKAHYSKATYIKTCMQL